MMLEFLETGKALYVLAAVCGLGLFSRLVARSLYKRLVKETDNMTLTKNRYLRDLKQKAENTYRLNQGINNSRVYLEKQLSTYRFLGLTLSGWGSFGGQMTILCFLLGGAASFGAYWYRCDSYYIVLYGSVGILMGLGTMAADYWANLSERRQQLLNALQDYMDNSLFNRLVRENAATMSEESRKEGGKAAPVQRDNIRTLERRGGRTEWTVRAVVNSSDAAEESEKNMDQDLVGRDLEELSQTEYGKQGGSGERGKKDRAEFRSAGLLDSEDSGDREQRRAGRGAKRNSNSQDARDQESGRRDVDYLKSSLEQIAASRERNRTEGDWVKDLSPDELELVGQLLRQYLN